MIELVKDTIDKRDINRLIKWLRTYPRLTKGPLTVEFENKWSKMLGVSHSTFVNSGSSAIIMMLQALLEGKRIDRGCKIVVPALSWATDFSSVVQLGFEPVICDCNLQDLSVDLSELEKLFQTENPQVLLLVSVLGLVPDMHRIVKLCKEYKVILLEDACESLGSRYKGQQLGTFGTMSIFSSYFGHHISTIEGGMVCTNDPELDMVLKAIRNHGWDRDLTSEQKSKLQREFHVDEFSALYTFYYLGFNFRSTDLQAFLGLDQLDKLNKIVDRRNKNYRLYRKLVKTGWQPTDIADCFVSNFAYPVISKAKNEIVTRLQDAEIQVRPLIAGSMTNQPFFTKNFPNRFKTDNAMRINEFGLYVPNHPMMKKFEVEKVAQIIVNAEKGAL
jgi:CDP-6-deoxy-D-xylo-4-hexulose-3-dehydrase